MSLTIHLPIGVAPSAPSWGVAFRGRETVEQPGGLDRAVGLTCPE